jgi:hypothetical protein
MSNQHASKAAGGVLLSLMLVLGGCSSNSVESQVAAMNSSNIKRVANVFAAWQNSHGGEGPKDLETLKTFTKGIPVDALQNMKIDTSNLDQVFVSERDGKPFKIKFGAVRPAMAPHIPIVFEADGVDGVKQVAWTNAAVQELNDTQCQALWDNKPVPPTTPGSAGVPATASTMPTAK